MALLNQIYRLFRCQYDQRKAETGHSDKAEKLLTELKFFIDDKDDKGYVGYLRLVKAQRDEGLEYVRMDEAVFTQYATQLLRRAEVTPMPADPSITNTQPQDSYRKVAAWNAANAKTHRSHADVPMPEGTPPLASKKDKEAPIPRHTIDCSRTYTHR